MSSFSTDGYVIIYFFYSSGHCNLFNARTGNIGTHAYVSDDLSTRLQSELEFHLAAIMGVFKQHLPELVRRQEDVTSKAGSALAIGGIALAAGQNYASSSHVDKGKILPLF